MTNTFIGGADGPTAIFLAGKLGIGWLNIFGLIIIILILIPNIIYAFTKGKGQKNKCNNAVMNILEQIGRYGSMFFMVFNIGVPEFGFSDLGLFFAYLFGNLALILLYWFAWVLYFIKPRFWAQIALAVIPTAIFLLCGITLSHIFLMVFTIIFGIAHVYVTTKNRVE